METTRHFAAMWVVADETECLTFLPDIVAVEAHLSEREQAEVGQFTIWQQRSLGEERAIDRGPFPFFGATADASNAFGSSVGREDRCYDVSRCLGQ